MSIQKIGIAGAGTMGYSMADIFAAKGFDVTLWNHRASTLEKAKTHISAASRDKIHYTTQLEDIADSDLIVESVTEDLQIKTDFYDKLSRVVENHTIVATNTSGLSINALAAHVKHPDRFLGMHWFNPPTLILLIEIIKNDHTRQDVAETVRDLSLRIGKKPVIVNKDVFGFAANRLQLAVLREALSMVEQGVVSPEGIDDVMKYGLGFRWACIGPLETVDFGGIDTFYHIAEYLMPDLEDSHAVPALLKEHYDKGELGVKAGKGFYEYSGGKDTAATKARDEKLKKLFDALYK
ncbi:MAG: 3-hydroxyacyl-CoA dehydrogenase family protein [Acidaminococcaceae bacterium]|nr:3-hydroxyacyl-CoA dehydrogenase family protein [Acidaminococcaceae bacterium]HCJ90856.1 3-hydroxybutyryl-CoA dehydrogenase [Acidaminococcaceae bacterium]